MTAAELEKRGYTCVCDTEWNELVYCLVYVRKWRAFVISCLQRAVASDCWRWVGVLTGAGGCKRCLCNVSDKKRNHHWSPTLTDFLCMYAVYETQLLVILNTVMERQQSVWKRPQVEKPYENWRRTTICCDAFCCFPTALLKYCVSKFTKQAS